LVGGQGDVAEIVLRGGPLGRPDLDVVPVGTLDGDVAGLPVEASASPAS